MVRFINQIIGKLPIWVATTTVLAIILWLTLARFEMDSEDVPDIPHLDKLVHFIMFGGLAWISTLDYAVHRRKSGKTIRIITVAFFAAFFSSLTGAAVELAQGAMGLGRSADIYDWVADTAGAITGSIFAYISQSQS